MGQRTTRVSRRRFSVVWVTCMAMVMSTIALSTDVARAATHQVCEAGCAFTTVQGAIDAAAPGDTILIQPGTYAEHLDIAIDIDLVGGGSGSTILDGSGAGTVMSVAAGSSVSISDLQIRNGHAENGGGVDNQGELALERVVITGNTADDGGAGIYNSGTLTVIDSTVAANTGMLDGTGHIGGGGIAVSGTSAGATISGSSITDNALVKPGTDDRGGGGISVKGGDLVLTDSVVADNSSGFSAGGIYASGSTTEVTVTGSTISGNVTGTDPNRTGGRGGGLDLRRSAQTVISESTISGNVSTASGGGLHIDAPTTIRNSTISGNHATGSGGGVQADVSFSIVGVTVASNTADLDGGGVQLSNRTIVAENSVLADNSASLGGPDCYGTVSSAAGQVSFVEDPAGCVIAGDGTVLTGSDPGLESLGNNGGSTLTHLPGAGSPLIDAGATALAADQRGEPRPSGAAADIGAVEVQQAIVDTTAPTWTDPTVVPTSIRSDGFDLEWAGAEDDVGIAAYEVMIDGVVVETVPGPEDTTSVSGLNAETAHQIEIQALDAAGNRSTDGPTNQVTTAPAPVSSDLLLPSPIDPDQGWQSQLPIADIDAARTSGEILLVASAGAVTTSVSILPFVPIDLDIDSDGTADIRTTVTLEEGPGEIPDAVLDVERLVQPGPSQVQVVALIPLPPELATELGQGTLVVGFGTTAPGGTAGGTLPVSETIRASLDTLGGLTHRLALDFTTVGADNPLEFYVGAAESQRVVAGAEAANLLGMHVSPVPSHVATSWSIDATGIAEQEPEMVAAWTWSAPSGETEPDVTFAYLESDRRRKDTAADYDTRAIVEGMNPETSLTATLVPDDSLEIALRHNDPANDPANGTFYDRLDRIEFLHEREGGLAIRAAVEDLSGKELLLRLDDGTGELTITNQTDIDLELEVSHPGDGFIDGFSNPIGWLFAAVQGTDSITVTPGENGGSEVVFGSRTGPTITFVAADDPHDLHFPGDQATRWPSSPPQDWPQITGWSSSSVVRLGVVDRPEGTTIALRASRATGFDFSLSPEDLSQAVSVGVPSGTSLDIDLELYPGAVVAEETTFACSAELNGGMVGFEIEAGRRYTFLSGGGEVLDCRAETRGRRYHAAADEFSDITTMALGTGVGSGEVEVVAEDDTNADDPLVGAFLVIEDDQGITGSEPFGRPAEYLALRAASLPSATIGWSRTPTAGTVLDLQSNAIEDRLENVKFILATDDETMTEPFSRPEGPTTLPLARTGNPPVFLPDATHSFHLWETGEISVLAGGVDAARHVEVRIDPTGATHVDLDTTLSRHLVTELGLPANGHFMESTSVVGWCDLAVPGGTSGISVALPLSVGLTTDHPGGFETLECLQRVGTPDGLNLDVALHGGSLPDQTQMTVDLVAGTAHVGSDIETIGHLGIDISDRLGDGLTGATPFAEQVRMLGLRLDEVDDFEASWTLDHAETSVQFEASQPVGAAQARFSTDAGAAPLGSPDPNHLARLRDEGGEADSEIVVRIHDLRTADVHFDAGASEPLRVEVGADQAHPLDVEVFVGFDSSLAPIENGSALEVDATANISRVRSGVYTTDMQASHRIVGAENADFDAHVVVDDIEGDDHALVIDIEAQDLPDVVGIDGYAMFSEPDQMVGVVDMSSELLSLDMVLADSRPTGIRETGSHRIRLHGVHVPAHMAFVMTGTEALDAEGAFDGDLAVFAELSDPMTRLLIESNRLDGESEPHFGTPFSQITIDLEDIPRSVEMLVSSDAELGTLVADFVFLNDPNRRRPALEDRIGAVEILLEKAPRALGDDRGLLLSPYSEEAFTEIARSSYVAAVDDDYWNSEVRGDLDSLDGRGFSLVTGTALQPVAADGAGATVRTRASGDYLIVSANSNEFEETDINDLRLLALRLEDVHAIEASLDPTRQEVRVRRPEGLSGGAMYVAIEGDDHPRYDREPLPDVTDEGDRAIEVSDRYLKVDYEDFISGTTSYRFNVLKNIDDVDPDTLSIELQAIHGEVTVDEGIVRYEPDSSTFVGHDVFVFEVCSATDASVCASALAEVVVRERFIGGYYAQASSVPGDFTIYLDQELAVAPDLSISYIPEAAGFTASDRPGSVDVLVGPRTSPPITDVPLTRFLISQAPMELEVDLTEPKAVNAGGPNGLDLALKVKVDTSGGTELVGVQHGPDTRVWFGLSGEDVSLETQGIGLIRHVLTGSRPDTDFRGCDRIFGKIDTCVTLIGLAIEGELLGDETREKLSGFVAVSPRSETTADARSRGAANEEYLPLFTATLTDASELSGSVQLQLEPFCTFQCEIPPFDVDGKVRIRAKDSSMHLWDRGFFGEVIFPAITSRLVRVSSDVSGKPWLIPG